MLIAALDPGKMHDSFGFVVIRVDEDSITVRAAREWKGRDYADVERTVAKYHLKHNFDHIVVVEQNNIGVHVIETLIRQYNLPIVAVFTSKNIKDNKKVMSAKTMDKNMMANYIATLMKHTDEDGNPDPKLKFPKNGSKDMKELERQVAIFAEHRTESGNVSYHASGQEHDDLAMALMLAVHIGRYYIRRDEDTEIKVFTKNIIEDYDDELGTGVPLGAVSKGRFVLMP